MVERGTGLRPTVVAIITLMMGSAGLAGVALLLTDRSLAIDIALTRAARGLDDGAQATVFKALGLAAGLPMWFAIAATIGVVIGRFRPRQTREFVGIMILTEITTGSVKAIVDRARPLGSDVAEILMSAGFPSGHVARTAVACAFVLTLVSAGRGVRVTLGLVALGIIILMGLARVAVGAHYVTDVLGGTLLAAFVLATWQLGSAVRTKYSTHDLGGRTDAQASPNSTR